MPRSSIRQSSWRRRVRRSAVVAVALLLAHFDAVPDAAARTISATGSLQPLSTVTLGSYLSAPVQEVSCEINSNVKQGQVCAKLDPRPFQNAVEQARADLAQAKAQLELDVANLTYAQASFERSSTLTQKGWTSKDAFENMQANYGQARARVELDKANI